LHISRDAPAFSRRYAVTPAASNVPIFLPCLYASPPPSFRDAAAPPPPSSFASHDAAAFSRRLTVTSSQASIMVSQNTIMSRGRADQSPVMSPISPQITDSVTSFTLDSQHLSISLANKYPASTPIPVNRIGQQAYWLLTNTKIISVTTPLNRAQQIVSRPDRRMIDKASRIE